MPESELIKFTTQAVSYRYTSEGALPYEDIPGLMNGELQAQCQQAFRQYLLAGEPPFFVAATINSQALERHEAWPIVALNAAYAISAPCEDMADILAYAKAVCDSCGEGCFKSAQKTTRRLVEAHPVNPYQVFKQSSVEQWAVLEEAYGVIRDGILINLAVLFDDANMVKKYAQYNPTGFVKDLSLALAKVKYDPLANVRSWVDAPNGLSMLEVEKRVNSQFNSVRSPLDSDYFLSKTHPEFAKASAFIQGKFDIETLKFDSTDHHLRHLPRYYNYLNQEPESIGRAVQDLYVLSNGNPQRNTLATLLIQDLLKAGLTLTEVHFKYCRRLRTGEIMHLADQANLEETMVLDLLTVSEHFDDMGDTGRSIALHLLSLAPSDLVKRLATSDAQIRSAYMATKDRSYLERLSGVARDAYIGADLGL
ncbi:hypothetical protein IFT48_01355 [Pseudomonas fluorescens]|uniref:hypothetical protein n=1 Tax=Pseudomonas TaxID=286 RepID=UPI000F014068|nr:MULTISPECIES: hypothetical protein [Pseudomonas]MBD8088621.1 hypothetical protein [Pseudomonas fluorescens]